jgi:hypothetical protein
VHEIRKLCTLGASIMQRIFIVHSPLSGAHGDVNTVPAAIGTTPVIIVEALEVHDLITLPPGPMMPLRTRSCTCRGVMEGLLVGGWVGLTVGAVGSKVGRTVGAVGATVGLVVVPVGAEVCKGCRARARSSKRVSEEGQLLESMGWRPEDEGHVACRAHPVIARPRVGITIKALAVARW